VKLQIVAGVMSSTAAATRPATPKATALFRVFPAT
jgi:hypothetical protein